MSMSVSASNNALAYLQQLLQSGSGGVGAPSTDPLLALGQTLTGAEGASQPQAGTSPIGSGSAPTFETGTLAALISLQGQSASAVVGQSPSDLFSRLDTDGDGQISKTEFEQALGAVGVDTQSADALFGKLDANNDGNVSPSEIAKGRGHHHHHHAESSDASQSGGSQQDGLSALLNSTDISGATTQTATNSDGSTTTTISYADGTSVSMTTPAATQNSGSSNNGTSSDGTANNGSSGPGNNNNLIEELIRMQSQLVTQAASALSTIA
ncbi:MAG: EF-hand domain-containing protein [Pseudolabrys sp.]